MTIHLGALPESIVVAFENDEADPIDFSAVTAAVLEVRPPNAAGGSFTEWAADIVTQSPTQLQLEHTIQSGEITRLGFYTFRARLTISGGTRWAGGGVLQVYR